MIDNRPPSEWPSQGKIDFENVTVSYNEKLAPVLSDLSFSTKPAEKIGIVGRTGAVPCFFSTSFNFFIEG